MRYAQSLPVDTPTKPIANPVVTEILQEDDISPVLSPQDATLYRSLLGAFAYLLLTRLDLVFAVSYFGRYNHQPTEKSYRLLIRAAQYAKSTADYGINYPIHHSNRFILTAYSDASLASYRNNAMSGYLICLDGSPISYRGGRQRKVRNSSTSAECEAMHDCLDAVILLMYFIHQCVCTVLPQMLSDSLDLVKLLLSEHPKPLLKHMLIELRAMQDKLGLNEREIRRFIVPLLSLREAFNYYPQSRIQLKHIAGSTMPADAFTKPSDVNILKPFLSRLQEVALNDVMPYLYKPTTRPYRPYIEYDFVPCETLASIPVVSISRQTPVPKIQPWNVSRLRDRSKIKTPDRLSL